MGTPRNTSGGIIYFPARIFHYTLFRVDVRLKYEKEN